MIALNYKHVSGNTGQQYADIVRPLLLNKFIETSMNSEADAAQTQHPLNVEKQIVCVVGTIPFDLWNIWLRLLKTASAYDLHRLWC